MVVVQEQTSRFKSRTIRSSIRTSQTSAIFIENYFGAVNNVTVNNNLLVGGGYTVYLVSNTQSNGGGGQGGPVTNVSYTNNDIGTG